LTYRPIDPFDNTAQNYTISTPKLHRFAKNRGKNNTRKRGDRLIPGVELNGRAINYEPFWCKIRVLMVQKWGWFIFYLN
jgi:hypothetical protein